jgi:hypothetical protein
MTRVTTNRDSFDACGELRHYMLDVEAIQKKTTLLIRIA